MTPKSVPEQPKLIFGSIAYFVAPANEKHTFCIPQITKNHQKSAKNASNASARKKGGLQGRLLLIFDDFGGPQGGSKITKNQKSAFQKTIEKKDEKKGNTSPWLSAAAFAQPRESKDSAQEGSCQVQKTSLKHASTPGGVRRIVNRLREDRRTPLHSWRSRMCRELLRILAAPVRILPKPW